jgi:TetR/AcrR family transcriptional regulator, transcriptional repressor for nem operon
VQGLIESSLCVMSKISTKEKIIRVALDLFHENGINATSVDEILKASGTGKSQFYYYFKSKEGLISAVLDSFFEFIKSEDSPIDREIQSWEDLEVFLSFFVTMNKCFNKPRACPLGFIGVELNASQIELSEQVNEIFDYIKLALKKFFDKAKKNGDLKKNIDSASLADFCLAILQGGLMTSKIRRDIKPLKASIKHAFKYLKAVRG